MSSSSDIETGPSSNGAAAGPEGFGLDRLRINRVFLKTLVTDCRNFGNLSFKKNL